LTVWRELRRQLPQEDLLYFGDTARLPYGQRSPAEILQYVREILAWMVAHPVKMVVMACNTSSALALDQVRTESPVPLLGLILPGARAAVAAGSRIGVIATPATVGSHAYLRAITEVSSFRDQEVFCWEQPCPEFVPLIEANQLQSQDLIAAIHKNLDPLLQEDIDTLVYGCTHYPLLDPLLRPLLPVHVQVIDPAYALVQAVVQELELWGLRRLDAEDSCHHFYVSGDPESFTILASHWLDQPPLVKQVQLQPVYPFPR
jgi:glutamate racemase